MAFGYFVCYLLSVLGVGYSLVYEPSPRAEALASWAVLGVLLLITVVYLVMAFSQGQLVLATPSAWQVIAAGCLVTGLPLLAKIEPVAWGMGTVILLVGALAATLNGEKARKCHGISSGTPTKAGVVLFSLVAIVAGAILLPLGGIGARQYFGFMLIWSAAFIALTLAAPAAKMPSGLAEAADWLD